MKLDQQLCCVNQMKKKKHEKHHTLISLVDDVYTNPPTQKEMHSLRSIKSSFSPELIITPSSFEQNFNIQCTKIIYFCDVDIFASFR